MVKIEHRIKLSGNYNSGVYKCDNCRHSCLKSLYNNIIGFNESTFGMVAIVECPECKKHWFYHARTNEQNSHYDYFLEAIEAGTQKHFKK